MTTSKLTDKCVGDTSSKLTDSWVIDKQLSDRKPDNKQQAQAANSQVADSQVADSQVTSTQVTYETANQLTVPVCAACDVNLDHAGSLIGDNTGVKTGNSLGNTALCERVMYT